MRTDKDPGFSLDLESVGKFKQLSPADHHKIDSLIGRINSGLGPFFYLFYNFSSQKLLHISNKCEEISGFTSSNWHDQGPDLLIDHLPAKAAKKFDHQSELCWNLVETLPPESKIRSSVTFNFTLFHNKQSRHLLIQHTVVTTGEKGGINLCLAVYTDITHLKDAKDDEHVFSSVYIPKSEKQHVYNIVTGELIDLNKLTIREKQVLAGYGSGKHTEKIADELSISPYTVQTHLSKLFKKTGCSNIAELIHFARMHSVQ